MLWLTVLIIASRHSKSWFKYLEDSTYKYPSFLYKNDYI